MSKKVSESDLEVVAPVENTSPVSTPVTTPVPTPTSATQRSPFFFNRGAPVESKVDIEALAAATGTGTIVMAGLKAEYGWTDKTRLTRNEFMRLRDGWLTRPAGRGK